MGLLPLGIPMIPECVVMGELEHGLSWGFGG
jgi:hypothetical protein